MNTTIITRNHLDAFKRQLRTNEKSYHTIRKYLRDSWAFWHFADDSPLTKDLVVDYKQSLIESGKYTDNSINSILASLRGFFRFLGREDCSVTSIRTQEPPYCPDSRWLAMDDYQKLLNAAGRGSRMEMILRVMVETGIRISELKYFTVEAVRKKGSHTTIRVSCKKKSRGILVSDKLREELLDYIKAQGITSGAIFCTRGGKPVDRSNLWKQMKRLGQKAGIDGEKVYPHNFRKLFARMFYEASHDLAQLACLLGHSSVNTTMLYVKRTESEVRTEVDWMLEKMQFERTAPEEEQDTQEQKNRGQKRKAKKVKGQESRDTKAQGTGHGGLKSGDTEAQGAGHGEWESRDTEAQGVGYGEWESRNTEAQGAGYGGWKSRDTEAQGTGYGGWKSSDSGFNGGEPERIEYRGWGSKEKKKRNTT